MNVKVSRINVKELSYREDLKSLFSEYSSVLETNIESNIVERLFELPYFHGFICYVDNQPAGFSVCYESFSTYRAKLVLNIHDFMISERFRGKGYGIYLMNAIEQYCHEEDYLKITLEVNENNTAAKKLYGMCGFQDSQVVFTRLAPLAEVPLVYAYCHFSKNDKECSLRE